MAQEPGTPCACSRRPYVSAIPRVTRISAIAITCNARATELKRRPATLPAMSSHRTAPIGPTVWLARQRALRPVAIPTRGSHAPSSCPPSTTSKEHLLVKSTRPTLAAFAIAALALGASAGPASAIPPVIDVERQSIPRPLPDRCYPTAPSLNHVVLPRRGPTGCPWWPQSPIPTPLPFPDHRATLNRPASDPRSDKEHSKCRTRSRPARTSPC